MTLAAPPGSPSLAIATPSSSFTFSVPTTLAFGPLAGRHSSEMLVDQTTDQDGNGSRGEGFEASTMGTSSAAPVSRNRLEPTAKRRCCKSVLGPAPSPLKSPKLRSHSHDSEKSSLSPKPTSVIQWSTVARPVAGDIQFYDEGSDSDNDICSSSGTTRPALFDAEWAGENQLRRAPPRVSFPRSPFHPVPFSSTRPPRTSSPRLASPSQPEHSRPPPTCAPPTPSPPMDLADLSFEFASLEVDSASMLGSGLRVFEDADDGDAEERDRREEIEVTSESRFADGASTSFGGRYADDECE